MAVAHAQEAAVIRRLSTLDRFLPLWIAVAMAAGLALGSLIPGLDDALDELRLGTVSLPIAVGLLLMMYPVLAKVRYEQLGRLSGEKRLMGASIVLNWFVGPLLMFALAWVFLADQPEYRTGLIIVGLARCIAMVLIWSDLAKADNEATALLVAINSLFQILAFSLLGWLYLTGLPDLLGLDTQGLDVSIWEVARTVSSSSASRWPRAT
jgi:ACR3 family arsenite transporter